MANLKNKERLTYSEKPLKLNQDHNISTYTHFKNPQFQQVLLKYLPN